MAKQVPYAESKSKLDLLHFKPLVFTGAMSILTHLAGEGLNALDSTDSSGSEFCSIHSCPAMPSVDLKNRMSKKACLQHAPMRAICATLLPRPGSQCKRRRGYASDSFEQQESGLSNCTAFKVPGGRFLRESETS